MTLMGFEFEGAKRPTSAADAPSQASMRASNGAKIQRAPSTDQKKARHQQARKQAVVTPNGSIVPQHEVLGMFFRTASVASELEDSLWVTAGENESAIHNIGPGWCESCGSSNVTMKGGGSGYTPRGRVPGGPVDVTECHDCGHSYWYPGGGVDEYQNGKSKEYWNNKRQSSRKTAGENPFAKKDEEEDTKESPVEEVAEAAPVEEAATPAPGATPDASGTAAAPVEEVGVDDQNVQAEVLTMAQTMAQQGLTGAVGDDLPPEITPEAHEWINANQAEFQQMIAQQGGGQVAQTQPTNPQPVPAQMQPQPHPTEASRKTAERELPERMFRLVHDRKDPHSSFFQADTLGEVLDHARTFPQSSLKNADVHTFDPSTGEIRHKEPFSMISKKTADRYSRGDEFGNDGTTRRDPSADGSKGYETSKTKADDQPCYRKSCPNKRVPGSTLCQKHSDESTKESSMNSRQRETQLLTALASGKASLDEQRSMNDELVAIRQGRRQSVAASRELALSESVIRDTLTPVSVHEHHTAATDWILEQDSGAGDPHEIQRSAQVEASLWFNRIHVAVRADREEYAEQARGQAHRFASALGESYPLARAAYLETAFHLAGANDPEQSPGGDVDEDQSGNAESHIMNYDGINPETFDTFVPQTPEMPGVSSERAPNVTGSRRTASDDNVCHDLLTLDARLDPSGKFSVSGYDDAQRENIIKQLQAHMEDHGCHHGITDADQDELKKYDFPTLNAAIDRAKGSLKYSSKTALDEQSGYGVSSLPDVTPTADNAGGSDAFPWEIGETSGQIEGVPSAQPVGANDVANVPTPGQNVGDYPQPQSGGGEPNIAPGVEPWNAAPEKTASGGKCSNCTNGNHSGMNGTAGCQGGSCNCSCQKKNAAPKQSNLLNQFRAAINSRLASEGK